MKKNIFLVLALAVGMTACTEDYTDWADPQSTDPETPEVVSLSVEEAASVNMAEVDSDLVQTFVPVLLAADGTTHEYILELSDTAKTNTVEIAADENGYVSASELQSIVETFYGKRPVEREMIARLVAYVNNNGTAVKLVSENFIVRVTPEAPVIEEAYYYIGALTNWTMGDTTYKFDNGGGDVYDNPVFTVTIPAAALDADGNRTDHWFAIAPQSAYDASEWSMLLGTKGGNGCTDLQGYLDVRTNLSDDGSFCMPASDGASYYKISINMIDYTYTIEPMAFQQYIYYIGSTDGWSAAEQKLESPNFDGVYTGYLYCADPNGWGNQFKFQKTPGDWSTEINSGNFSSFNGAVVDAGGNFGVSGGQSVYYFVVDLASGSITATEITNMNLVGDFNGWNAADDAQQMSWDAENFCYVINNAGVTSNGWKFTANNAWDINLGGSVDKLEANGANLDAVGTTIKLYPTRRGSDNIYATVE